MMIVRLYGSFTEDEKVILNVVGIPDAWPAEVSLIDDEMPVPDGWVAMTSEELVAQKATYQSAYDAWVESRIPPTPEPDDDTSPIQINSPNAYISIIRRMPRRGSYAVFFNANASAKVLDYCVYLDDEPISESERTSIFSKKTDTTLATHAETYVSDGQMISIRVMTTGGPATITNRSIVLIQKDAE